MHRVEKWLHEHGRELIGWDEIMQGGISKSAVIMAWTDQFRGTDAARKGNRVIMTPKWNCYLDYSQTSDPEKYEPIGPTRYLSMRQVYRLDPYDRLKPAEYRNILGIQGNVWTEYIADFGHVQRMTLPRMAAIAEIAWAYERKDDADFGKRAKRLVTALCGHAIVKVSEFFFEDIACPKPRKSGSPPHPAACFSATAFRGIPIFSTFTQSYDTPCQITNTTFTCG